MSVLSDHIFPRFTILRLLALSGVLFASSATANELVQLGEALFFDTNLSANRTQACASCHDPAAAFSDSRDNGISGAVSLGDDGESLGDRNAPTITYAMLIPVFGRDTHGEIAGGTFHDGRAASMLEQAGQPFTNPIEMALSDKGAVVKRVHENPAHADALKQHFGETIFDDTVKAFAAITESIVAFEQMPQFAPFDSKYDRYLRGEYKLSKQEEVGRKLFFSQLFNCHSCHLIDTREDQEYEAFSNHRYHNIGLPVNAAVRQENGLGSAHVDQGLLENPDIDDPLQAGKFRVPTLRNVAVTGPYMHNGIFRDLRTVVLYYNKFTLSNAESQTNPETGQPWGESEVPDTVNLDLLSQGQPISALQVGAIVEFLNALTDQRYEGLIDQ
ncbi:MAG: cytochrome c peroxidase [Pseudomonadales bacterium]|nr:cytochrome c peroxidase [Pseudomonadales bacterium]